ncbi:DUF1345 domain-containing protein [Rugosimonospora acidiphila]|uniref:DUF1345 domain-containing protein n=1 Tax=Rugosimonospora acidiphila TaxID=556531 RepID=A0ABP9RP11_9ACTN
MPFRTPEHHSAVARVGLAAAAGLIGGALAGVFGPGRLAPLIGWDAMALTWVGLIWSVIWPMNAERTAQRAGHEDPTRPIADVLLIFAAVASLVAVGFVLVQARHAKGMAEFLLVVLAIASIVLSWTLVHTTFTLRYARMYYTGPDGGVGFNQTEAPAYSDFAYMAFTIGMTFQVSDTKLETKEARSIALRHAMLSYMFGTVIVAVTINLVAGLGH